MPQKYRVLSSHADAKPKAGTTTAPGLFKSKGSKKVKKSKKAGY